VGTSLVSAIFMSFTKAETFDAQAPNEIFDFLIDGIKFLAVITKVKVIDRIVENIFSSSN
jgi:hypothetical protein